MKAKALLAGFLLAAATALPALAASGTLISTLPLTESQQITRFTGCNPFVQTQGVLVPYATFPFTVDLSGSYTFSVTNIAGTIANDNDLIIGVYTSFDPANPNANCLGVVDDASGFIPSITVPLTGSTQYTMFVSNYDTGETGTFDVTYSGPGTAISLQPGNNPLATDGRLNPDPQATAVLYCNSTTGVVDVYRVTGSSGTFAFSFGTQDVTDAAAGDVFASASGITVEKLADGRLLLRSPLPDGKNYLFVWSGCPLTSAETYTEDFAFGSPILTGRR
jgi:hypothetical protein